MYKSFEVRNFRCFPKLAVANLERVNLIAGENNVGKTALLEALFLHCGAYNPELTLRCNAFRGIEQARVELGPSVEAFWESFFSGFDTSKVVELVGENSATGSRWLRLKVLREPDELAQIGRVAQVSSDRLAGVPPSTQVVPVLELEHKAGKRSGKHYLVFGREGPPAIEPSPPPPPFPTFFLGARVRHPLGVDAERFGKLETVRREDVVLKALEIIEPRLSRLSVVVAAGVPMIHGDIGLDRLVPLPVMGEGMARLASLVLAIGNAPKGVVLVDEIENGLHHSVLPKVWLAIGKAAREFETQVFATTHSLECIVAAHQAFSRSARYDFRLHRLDRTKDGIVATTYDQETLAAAVDMGFEVR